MLESKKCVLSFDSKESILYLNIMDQNISIIGGSNIHVSNLVLNKLKDVCQENSLDKNHIEDILFENVSDPVLSAHQKFMTNEADLENKKLFANSVIQKRKFEVIDKDKNEFRNNTCSSKYPRISDSYNLKEKYYWEQYTNIKPYSMKSYSSLLPSKPLISNSVNSDKSSHLVNSLSSSNSSSSVYRNKSSLFLVGKCLNSETVEKTFKICNLRDINRNSHFNSNSKHAPKENNLTIKSKKMTNATNDSIESIPNVQMHHGENFSPQSLFFPKSISAVSPLKYIEEGGVNAADIEAIFTTAAGKSISISEKAMLAAQKFIQDGTHQEIDRDVHCSSVEKKQFLKRPFFKKNNLIPYARSHKDDKITTGEVGSKSIKKNHDSSVVSYDAESAQFSTAAGKKIDVSEAAMKAANKLIHAAFENEENIMPSTSVNYKTHKKKGSFQDIGCPPKKLLIQDNDETMDNDLVEKFFQDAVFDEKESEDITEFSKNNDFNEILESKKSNEPGTHRIRKSLGGRRSMRFYPEA